MTQVPSQLNLEAAQVEYRLRARRSIRMTSSLHRRTDEQEDEEIGIDRISELPESLITTILSLLAMEDAVTTCVLSKKWKYAWTHVDNYVFEFELRDRCCVTHEQEQVKRFMSFVDRTLMQCTCSKIKTFSLTGNYMNVSGDETELGLRMGKLVDKWLKLVIGKNVQFIKLEFPGLKFPIPDCLYHTSTLERLEIFETGEEHEEYEDIQIYHSIANMELRGGGLYHRKTFDVSWNNLKSLDLCSVHVADEFMVEILSGSPMLETLSLDHVLGLSKLNITSPNVSELKLLNMSEYFAEDGCALFDITAPWVKKLELGEHFSNFICNLVNVTSLEKAKITLRYGHYEHVDMRDRDYLLVTLIDKLLKPVCRVVDLCIGAELLQALSLSQMTTMPSIQFRCKDLALDSYLCAHDIPGIACILQSSPNLENLVIKLDFTCHISSAYGSIRSKLLRTKYGNYIHEVSTSFDVVDYLSHQNKKFPCLKNLKIDSRKIAYPNWKDKTCCYELETVAYIIKNAPSLEKLVLLCPDSNYSEFGHQYYSLLTSESKIGKIAMQRRTKRRESTHEFRFQR